MSLFFQNNTTDSWYNTVLTIILIVFSSQRYIVCVSFQGKARYGMVWHGMVMAWFGNCIRRGDISRHENH